MILQNQVHAINFSRKLAMNAVFFLIPLYFLKLGFGGWQIGIVVSLFAFAPLAFAFPTGWVNDRFSIKKMIKAAFLATGFLILIVSRTADFALMALVYLLLGVANNILDVSTNSLYFKDETRMDLNRKYGKLTFWLSLGTALGPIAGGLIIHAYGFPTLFGVFVFFFLGLAVFVPRLEEVRFGVVQLADYKNSIFRKKTLMFSLIIFIVGLHWGVEGTVYSPFLKSHFGLNDFQVSLYISLPLFFLAFSALFISKLKYDAVMNKRLFLLALFLSGSGLILMVNKNVYLSAFFRIIHEVGDGFLGALIVLFISRLFERKSIGGSSGALFSVMMLGQMVGALLFSPLGHQSGLRYPFYVAGALLILNSVYAFFVFRRVEYLGDSSEAP